MLKTPQTKVLLALIIAAVVTAVGCGDGRRHGTPLRKGAPNNANGLNGKLANNKQTGNLSYDQNSAENSEEINRQLEAQNDTSLTPASASTLEEGQYTLESIYTFATYSKDKAQSQEQAYIANNVSVNQQGQVNLTNAANLSAGLNPNATVNVSRALDVPVSFQGKKDTNGLWAPDASQAVRKVLATSVSQDGTKGLKINQSTATTSASASLLELLASGDGTVKDAATGKTLTLKVLKIDDTHIRLIVTVDEISKQAVKPTDPYELLGMTYSFNYSVTVAAQK